MRPGLQLRAIKSAISPTGRYLHHREPSRHSIPVHGWILPAPALNPLEEDLGRRREIMQFNGGAKRPGSESQGVPLGPSPSAPFDDYRVTEREEFPAKFPLQRLDLRAPRFIVEI